MLVALAVAPTCMLGEDGAVGCANAAFARLFGRDPGDPPATLAEVLPPDALAPLLARLDALAPGEAAEAVETQARGAGAALLMLDWSVRRAPDGARLFAQVRDVTQERLRRRHAEAVEALTGVGAWEGDLADGALWWSPGVFAIHELDPAGPAPGVEGALAFYPEPHRTVLRAALARLIEDGEPVDLELPLVTAAGREIWVRATGRRERGTRLFGVFQDVTAERARRLHLERLGAVASRTSNAVFITDADRNIVWVNPAFTALTGYAPEEVIGRRPRHFLRSPRTDAAVMADLRAKLDAGGGGRAELLNLTKSGEERWVSVDIQPLPGPDGRLTGFISVETDISARKAAEARLQEAERAAREARERLEAAVEALPDAFVFFDADDRLVICNERYRQFYPRSGDAMVPGARFEDILRAGLARGEYADAAGREEDWLAARLAAHRRPELTLEQRLADGRWLRVLERMTPEGGRVGLRVDITELKRQQQALEAANAELQDALALRDAAEARFAQIAEVSADWFWETDAEGRFTFLSDGFARITGADPAAVIGRTREELLALNPDSRASADWDALFARIAAREPFSNFVHRALDQFGRDVRVLMSGAPWYDRDGRFAGYRGVNSDVTALHTAMEEARSASLALAATLDAIPDTLMEVDADGRVLSARPGGDGFAVTGGADPVGRRLADLFGARAAARLAAALQEAETAGAAAGVELMQGRGAGRRWFSVGVARKSGGAGGPLQFVLLARDITAYKRAAASLRARQTQLRRAATTDSLTGLLNRRGLQARLARLAREAREAGPLVIMHVDLDRFKAVNDTLGHGAGDQVLTRCAEVLSSETRGDDIVARVGGDEFVVVCRDLGDRRRLGLLADRLVERLSEGLVIDDKHARIGASVGIALWDPAEQPDPERPLTDADIALYAAKAAGRGRWRVFEPAMRRRAEEVAHLSLEIRAGLERGEFEPFLQPQVSLHTGEVIGYEALARWRHPRLGLLSPGAFLFAAEEANLVDRIDEFMLGRACAALAALQAAGLPAPQVSVNLSSARLGDPDVVEAVKWTVDAHGLAPAQVALEILESALLDARDPQVIDTVRRFAAAGFPIELDDFGTGHASISNLRALRVDRIKIDRSFVTGVDRDAELRLMTGAISALGRNLGLAVLAEGVETEAELACVRALGCDAAQGYLFAAPAPPGAVMELLRGEAPAAWRRLVAETEALRRPDPGRAPA